MKTIPIPDDLLAAISYDRLTGIIRWLNPPTKSRRRGNVAGCVNAQGYVVVTFGGRQYAAHRIAWRLIAGADAPGMIDHVNGDRSDNRESNLRLASGQQNAANRRKIAGKSLPKGVRATGNMSKPFLSSICVCGRNIHLGTFKTPEAAAEAYRRAANTHFKDFSNTGRGDIRSLLS